MDEVESVENKLLQLHSPELLLLLQRLEGQRLEGQQLELLQHGDWKKDLFESSNKLGVVKAFLKDSSTKSYYSKTYQELVVHIRNCLCDIDDTIDDCKIQVATNLFPNMINLLAQKIDSVCDQIQTYKNVIGDFSTLNVQRRRSLQDQDTTKTKSTLNVQRRRSLQDQPPPLISERNLVIGLEEETKTVIGYLTEETEELDVIPIVGTRGIGKSTLAWKTFNSDEAMREFPTRIWINVSDEFNEEEVLLAILKHFTPGTDGFNGRDYELVALVASYLEREKFLIVMDYVRSASDWDIFRNALLRQSSKKGKILIISCNENVFRHDQRTRLSLMVGFPTRTRLPLKVGFLTPDKSWSLLRSEVFGDQECPPELEYIGQVIVEQCCGLPLAIRDMARTLLEEDLSSSNMKERRIAWTKVSSQVPRMFYLSLPNQARLCFLYFGMFPEGYDIPVWRLISMWIAEGFIQKRGSMSLEETAETYLEDLISRNLLITGRIKSSGKTKTCRIHPMLHEFCRIEAGNQRENFLQQIEFSDGDFHPPISDLSSYHRLSVNSNIVLDFLSSKPPLSHVRSFVCFGHDEGLPTQCSSVIPAGFKRLRVLDVMPIRLTEIRSDMYELVNLKFLALSFLDLKILPAEFSRLCNLQTLIVNTTSRTLEIGVDIWQLTQLRHLKTNASATFVKTGYHSFSVIETLAMVSPESFTEKIFATVRKLKKLGIRGKLSSVFYDDDKWFRLPSDLENLKLVNDVYPLPASSGKLHSLPSYAFPPVLRSLTLAQTFLDWSQMGTLGRLENLEVLKLKDHAFIGQNWITEDEGFKKLQVLHIDHTDLVIWEASAHHFPRLTSVELHYCKDLQKIPIQLADIPSLQCLELRDTNLAADAAIMIRDNIKNHRYQEGPSRNHEEFKLSIYPPIK